jgi:hypothetical protein
MVIVGCCNLGLPGAEKNNGDQALREAKRKIGFTIKKVIKRLP